MTIEMDLSILSVLDNLTRIVLLLLTALVFAEFSALSRENRTPLLRAILWLVGTTGVSVAYYVAVSAAPPELFMRLLNWGFVVQVPRVLAMLWLLKVLSGR